MSTVELTAATFESTVADEAVVALDTDATDVAS